MLIRFFVVSVPISLTVSAPSTAQTSLNSIGAAISALKATSTTSASLRQILQKADQSIAIVLVPGILGSKLVASDSTVIWGASSDYQALLSNLQLPASLIDEKAESGVTATVLDSFMGIDFYGDAIKQITATLKAVGISAPLITCGYDWRRDIRAGARDLERCIQTAFGDQHRTIIMIAHSMGGLVAWQWHQLYVAGTYSSNHQVLATAILGSPLEGSCEIIRMIQEGYVQPVLGTLVSATSGFKQIPQTFERIWASIVNIGTGTFTQDLRPIILTWPGAIELSPVRAEIRDKNNCVTLLKNPDDENDNRVWSYYDPDFWSTTTGKSFLAKNSSDNYPVPGTLAAVLAKADEFRQGLKVTQLNSPTYLYYSTYWLTPTRATMAPDNRLTNIWIQDQGDGRVPQTSARTSDQATIFADVRGLTSEHGNLPADTDFLSFFIHSQVPQLIDSYKVINALQEALTNPKSDWVDTYFSNGGVIPSDSEIRGTFERIDHDPNNMTQVTVNALETLKTFQDTYCAQHSNSQCVTTYTDAKDLDTGAVDKKALIRQITTYGMLMRTVSPDSDAYAYAEANKGLRLALVTDWSSAAIALKDANDKLGTLSAASSPNEQKKIDTLKKKVEENLGKSLFQEGLCKEAEPFLKATVSDSGWSFSRDTLAKPCNNREDGSVYTFASN